MVGGSFNVRSKPPKELNDARPLATSLPCESRSLYAKEVAPISQGRTSPPLPVSTKRAQPLTRTSSPGR